MNATVLDQLGRHRVVAVATLDDAAVAADVGAALAAGGVPVVEVTFRRPGAARALAALAADPALTVGAGTVLTERQAEEAAECGATFVVSPGLDVRVVQRAVELGLLAVPGAATATEIQQAVRLDVPVVKLFPAHLLGGPAAVTALSAPFPGMRFVPTGGVDQDVLARYLAIPSVLAVGGSWLVRPEWVQAGRLDMISAAARTAHDLVRAAA